MDSLWIAFITVLPLLLMMAVGFVIRRAGIMNETSVSQTNRAVYTVFLPLLIFENIRSSTLDIGLDPWFIFYVVVAILFQFLLALCIVLLSEKNNAKRGVMLQGMFHANYVLFGVMICLNLFGSETASSASLLITIVVPLFALLSIISLAMFDGGRPGFFKTVFGVFVNPLTIACILGILCVFFDIVFPDPIEQTISTLSSIATPLAFVLLGASFGFREVKNSVRGLTLTLLMKLLIFPAIFIGVGILLGYRGGDLAVLLAIFASPAAVSTFTLAGEMGGDEQLAGQLVIFSSLLSILTIFLFIFLLRYFAFL